MFQRHQHRLFTFMRRERGEGGESEDVGMGMWGVSGREGGESEDVGMGMWGVSGKEGGGGGGKVKGIVSNINEPR
jgi:hypothetical protein